MLKVEWGGNGFICRGQHTEFHSAEFYRRLKEGIRVLFPCLEPRASLEA